MKTMVNALRTDYRTAPISEQDRTMLDYVLKLTKDATKCGPEDHGQAARRWLRRSRHFADHANSVLV